MPTKTSLAIRDAKPSVLPRGPLLYDPLLEILAQQLDDVERLRKATGNRLGAMTRVTADEDGVVRGLALPENDPAVVATQTLFDNLTALEKSVTSQLEKRMKAHPLGNFIRAQKGLGLKTVARLLAAIRDPYWAEIHEKQGTAHVLVESRPRTVSELWAYCGYSVVNGEGQRRRKGQQANWSSDAKMRAWNIVQPIIKNGGPYRAIYDDARLKYMDATLADGTPLTLAHQHNRAVRAVAKAILKDLWIEAKKYYDEVASEEKGD